MIERMTADEIRIMYRDAKDKPKQITILADMNLCRRADIKAILDGETDELPPVAEKYHCVRKSPDKPYVPRNALTDKEKQEIIRLHLEGMQGKDIAAKLGRSQGAVSKTILSYKEGAMTFTEELSPEQNEKLLQEITEKTADKPQPEIPSITTENVGVVEIAGALMDFVTRDLGTHVVEIKYGKDGYTVRVENETEGIVLTRRHTS